MPANSPTTVCPHCGAALPASLMEGAELVRCANCQREVRLGGGSLPDKPESAVPPAPNGNSSTAAANRAIVASAGGLTFADLQGLSRPSVHPSGGVLRKQMTLALIWTLLSFILVAVGFGVYLRQQRDYNLLLNQGVMTTGVIADLDVDHKNDQTTYTIRYRFTAQIKEAPVEFEKHIVVSASQYASIGIGQKVEVVYLPSNPEVSTLKTELRPPDSLFPAAVGGIGLLLMAVGAKQLGNSMGALRALRKVERLGLAAQAVIYDKWSETSLSGSPLYLVAFAYEVPTPRGPLRITRAEVNPKAYRELGLGERVQVKYLPNDPETSFLVEYR